MRAKWNLLASSVRGAGGAATVEYAGLLCVIGIAAGALGAVTGIAAPARDLGRHVTCRVAAPVTGAVCASPSVDPRYRPCVVAGREEAERIGATVAFVRFGRGDVIRVERDSRGRWTVSLVDEEVAGLVLRLGAHAAVNGARVGASAEAGIGFTYASGRSWRFSTRAEMRRFVDRHSSAEGLGGELRSAAADLLSLPCGPFGGCNPFGWRKPRTPPPDVLHVRDGREVGVLLSAARPGASGSLEVSSAEVDGLAIDRGSGLVTASRELRTRGSLAVSALLGPVTASIASSRDESGVVEVAWDGRTGAPRRLVLRMRRSFAPGAAVRLEPGAGAGPPDPRAEERARAFDRIAASATAGTSSRVVEERQTLELRTAAARREALTLLHAASGSVDELLAATRPVARRLEREGVWDSETRDLKVDERSVEAGGGGLLSLGFRHGRTLATSRLVDAETRLPGRDWAKRWDCVEA